MEMCERCSEVLFVNSPSPRLSRSSLCCSKGLTVLHSGLRRQKHIELRAKIRWDRRGRSSTPFSLFILHFLPSLSILQRMKSSVRHLWRSLQDPSHSVFPQGFSSRSKSTGPRDVSTWGQTVAHSNLRNAKTKNFQNRSSGLKGLSFAHITFFSLRVTSITSKETHNITHIIRNREQWRVVKQLTKWSRCLLGTMVECVIEKAFKRLRS